MNNDSLWRCRVCGLKQDELPWGEDGTLSSHNICICCGVEFGFNDYTLDSIRNYREEWLGKKMQNG